MRKLRPGGGGPFVPCRSKQVKEMGKTTTKNIQIYVVALRLYMVLPCGRRWHGKCVCQPAPPVPAHKQPLPLTARIPVYVGRPHGAGDEAATAAVITATAVFSLSLR